ncbi:unnamed protein product [Rotaria sp. Silwood2]|nr:unnamed protein product [Rotaria sp. Silwood2]CAF2940389.1 unnamed protein product [Rotaria sp. Silwood2]CAF3319143.1 unnamed protein product [Rotaria sp. Silwood2]CAF4045015.1 unnamed protein product [Rotaria sp. Silwood2]CAF4096652.1 unnamed protein product [Rotaria sp. Silwood2]
MKWTQPRVPVLVGPMIPRRERDDTKERYYRAILTLFVPWRSVTDLYMQRIIENIQLLHECKKGRDEHLLQVIQEDDAGNIDPQLVLQHQINNNVDEDEIDDILNMIASIGDAVQATDVPATIIKSETAYFNELLTTISNTNRFPYLINDVQQQLIMCVPGSGGTGKSQLIGALTRYFSLTKQSHKLRKLAPTAIAATNICGMTIHSFLKDSKRKSKKKRVLTPGDSSIQNEWHHVQYIFIDEISMVGLRLLARFHEILTIAKSSDPSVPFGGINLVFFGDFMQYAPVLDKPLITDIFMQLESSVSNSTSEVQKSLSEYEIQCQVGRALFLQVNVVVKLTMQIRVEDKEYLEALDRLRLGECTMKDYELFRSLIIGRSGGILHSLSDTSWNNAPILVYRNEIRTELNNRAVINKCRELNYPLIVCLVQDKTKSKIIDENNHKRLHRFLLSLPDNKTESLPGYLP